MSDGLGVAPNNPPLAGWVFPNNEPPDAGCEVPPNEKVLPEPDCVVLPNKLPPDAGLEVPPNKEPPDAGCEVLPNREPPEAGCEVEVLPALPNNEPPDAGCDGVPKLNFGIVLLLAPPALPKRLGCDAPLVVLPNNGVEPVDVVPPAFPNRDEPPVFPGLFCCPNNVDVPDVPNKEGVPLPLEDEPNPKGDAITQYG